MSTEYHKISTPFKRHFDGPDKGKLIMGDWALPELKYLADNEWEFTEKVDGTNIRVELELEDKGHLHVALLGRTDNANIPKHLLEHLEAAFPLITKFDRSDRHRQVRSWMQDNNLKKVILYGEGYGPKIQKGGGNYRKDASFVLFDVRIGDFWLERENVEDVAKKLGIDAVPRLGMGTLWDAINIVKGLKPRDFPFTVSNGVFNGKPGLKSQWGDFEAEGIIARPLVPLFNRQGSRIITKIKGVDFK